MKWIRQGKYKSIIQLNYNRSLSIWLTLFICIFLSNNSFSNANKQNVSKIAAVSTESKQIKKMLAEAEKINHIDRAKTLRILTKALGKAQKIDDKNLQGEAENLIGDVYWYSSDFLTASEYYLRALKKFQQTKNRPMIAKSYRNIGWIYLGEKKFAKAESYFFKSAEIFKSLKKRKDYMIIMDDLANMYTTKGDYKKALNCCQISLKIAKEINSPETIGTTSGTTAGIYHKLKNNKKAEEYLLQSIRILEKIPNQTYNLCSSNINMAEIKHEENQNNEALNYINTAIQLAKKGKFDTELADACLLSSKINQKLQHFEQAYEMSLLYASTKEKLHELTKRDFIKELENKHKIQNLEQKGKLNEANLKREQTFKTFLILILVLIFIFGVFLVRSIIRKKKANASLSLAYQIIEEKNKDISDSIDYAQHIQQARLPLIENLKKNFADIFVYYVPRDTVSGDFYWFDKRDDGSLFFVSADCTGHGIPGAFMSMMGIDGFNYAILERNIQQPGEILTHVNQFIKDSLNQEHESAKSKDGMDAAIIYINPEKTKMTYSGANRPIYIVRNAELIELKPDKLSIGGNHLSNYQFSQKEFELQSGDSIYLFTDGYADQFGGKNGKKFMSKQLKDLFIEHHSKSMDKQRQIVDEKFIRWMNEHPQVDDVLVVGIRV